MISVDGTVSLFRRALNVGARGLMLVTLACAFTSAALAQGTSAARNVSLAQLLNPAPVTTQPGQSATLLPNGKWLLLGGRDASGAPVATALIVDPNTNRISQLPAQLAEARAGHSATLLPDGTVLILGGTLASGAISESPERFDPASGTFGPAQDPGLIPRAQHTATLLTDGRLLIAGGVDSRNAPLFEAELYDTFTGQIERFDARLDSARLNDLAALLPSSAVLLWGGVDANGEPLPGAELYDPTQLRFVPYTTENALALAAALQGPAAPAVTASEPADGAQSVPVDQVLSVRFSKRLDVTSLNAQSVVLVGAGGPVDVKVTPVGTGVLLFVTPTQQLLPDSDYTLFINGARDALGQALPFSAVGFKTVSLALGAGGGASTAVSGEPGAASANTAAPIAKNSSEAAKEAAAVAVAPAGDDDEWIPTAANFHGDWRSGRARANARLTLPHRPEVLRAIHGIGGSALSSVAAGVTAVAGQVLLLNGRPLANATLSIGLMSDRTDGNGEFLLAGVPSGGQTLVIDGGTASNPARSYGRYEYHMNVQAGKMNALPFVIWMTKLDTADAVSIPSPTTSETVVTTPRIPGLELHVPAGKVIRDAAGRIVTEISITAIPTDQPPFPLPNVPVPTYFTIQPGGAHLEDVGGNGSVGARLIYPNFTASPPGSPFDFWNYDSRDRGWYVYGHGSVSANGTQVIPDPGVAIYEFTGAMIGSPGNAPSDGPAPGGGCGADPSPPAGGDDTSCPPKDPPPPPNGCPDYSGDDGDPVDCYTGLFLHKRTDLRIRDVVPIEIRRTYRPRDNASRGFGIGTNLSYDMFLVGDTFPYTYQDLILPDGGHVHYVRISSGTGYADAVYQHTATPSKFYGSTLFWDGIGWTLQLKDGTIYKFPESYQSTARLGAPYRIQDRLGNAVNLVRDAHGNLTQIVSPNGRSIHLTYDTSNRVTQAIDDIGRTVTYAYDTSGRLVSVTDPVGGVEQYTYDTNNNMLTVRDKRGNLMVTNVYDTNNRVTSQTYADGTTKTFAYTLDGSGKVTQTDITDERGAIRRLAFNAGGYATTVTRALGQPEQQVLQRVIDSATNLMTSKTDAFGRTTSYQYDALGNVTQLTLVSGTPNAVSWTYTYESAHNQIATVTDPLSHTTTYGYDAYGNRTSITDPLNNVTQMTYNGAGQLASVTDPLNHTTSLAYFEGDLTSVTDPLGRTVTFGTDAVGRVLAVTDPLGNTSRIAYDALDRATGRTDALGHQVAYGYDANGNITNFTDARSNVTAFAYDVRNRLITKADALTQAESYQYDPAGNLLFVTDRKGQVRGYTYDLLGRRTQTGFGATSTSSPVYDSTIAYTYDTANRVTQFADSANGTIARQYDDRFNTVTQETTPQGLVSYTYDAAGRRASMTPSGGTQVNYTFDDASRLTQIVQGINTIHYAYDATNRRTSLTLANGVSISYGYDSANQVTGITYRNASNTLLGDLTYSYDLAGRRISIGGAFARTGLPDSVASAAYDANNRLTNWSGTSASYDANGSLLGFQGDSYTWNSRNQLAAITGVDTASFVYDAVGRRQSKTISAVSTQFLYDGLNPIQEITGTSITASLLIGLGIDEHLMRTEGANVQHYLTDTLGSTIRLTDGTGAKLLDYTYEAYGNTSADGASTSAYQYTGRENDGAGLYYYRARYLQPVLGRFISEDPIELAGGLNFYTYVNGNPIGKIDAIGLSGSGGSDTACMCQAAPPPPNPGDILGGTMLGGAALVGTLGAYLGYGWGLAEAGEFGAFGAFVIIDAITGVAIAGASVGAAAGAVIGGVIIGGMYMGGFFDSPDYVSVCQ